jgi:hypothetical protein
MSTDTRADLTIAAYYFPAWHVDPTRERWHGQGWTEWELLRHARPRFPGHRQPIIPGWGYFDEAERVWAEKQIDLAADHGIDCFLFDWYFYQECGPYLSRALDEGFLNASNRSRLRFALMWANHDWLHIFPSDYVNKPRVMLSNCGYERFVKEICPLIARRYFSNAAYLHHLGGAYFLIYDMGAFVKSMGGLDEACRALDALSDETRCAGAGELHLATVLWNLAVLPSETRVSDWPEVLRRLGVQSATSYTWVHDLSPDTDTFPRVRYDELVDAIGEVWTRWGGSISIPYYPCVSMGWDPSPRTVQSDRYDRRGYPWTGVIQSNTPQAFEQAMNRAIAFAREQQGQPMVTINAWNEWTEGSYLLPDQQHAEAYLKAVAQARKRSGC